MKLVIATPMYGGQCAGLYTDSMCRLYARGSYRLQLEHIFYYGSSLIPVARTVLANDFLKTDATHLLFIDADIGFKPEYVPDLIRLQQKHNYEVVGATYLTKNINWDTVISALRRGMVSSPQELNQFTGHYSLELLPNTDGFSPEDHSPIEVAHLGAGFMLIPRSTFELFRRKFPERTCRGGEGAYFQAEVQDGQYISEDAFFCRMIRKAGGKVWLCPWMQLAHVGSHVYGWNPTKVM